MTTQYLAAASHGIAVKQEFPDLFREALLPAGEITGLEFFIFPKGFLIISCLRRGISLINAGPYGRQILVRVAGSDTYWPLESTAAGMEEQRIAYHMPQAAAINAVIRSLRLCETYPQFQTRALTICRNWQTAWCMTWHRAHFAFDGHQLNFLSSQAHHEASEGDLSAEIQRFLDGEEIAGTHFLQLVLRKGLWYWLPPQLHEVLDKVAEGVGLHRAYAFDKTDLSDTWLMNIAHELAGILRKEMAEKEKAGGESPIQRP